eukprot:2790137-Rhodomonas_salina.1
MRHTRQAKGTFTHIFASLLLHVSVSAQTTCPSQSTLIVPQAVDAPMQHFAYTGATAQFTIPTGSNGFRFFIWGAGGGTSRSPSSPSPSRNTGYGGAGGFVTGTFTNTNFNAGDTIQVEVGRAGRRSDALGGSWQNAWLDGGKHCKGSTYYNFIPAGGGGSSRIYKTGTDAEADPLAVAGAGGGGGCAASQDKSNGGAGGMTVDTTKRGG